MDLFCARSEDSFLVSEGCAPQFDNNQRFAHFFSILGERPIIRYVPANGEAGQDVSNRYAGGEVKGFLKPGCADRA